MFGRDQRPQPDAMEVVLGARATFAGSLRSETSIRIEGAVEGGLIETPANVILTESARVTCEIVARAVSIRGQFHGTLRAERVELLAGSRVSGTLQVGSIYMAEGVVFQADVKLRTDGRAALPGAAPRPPAVLGVAPALPAPTGATPAGIKPAAKAGVR